MEQIHINFHDSIFQAVPSPLLSQLSCVSVDMGTPCIMPCVGLTFRPFQLSSSWYCCLPPVPVPSRAPSTHPCWMATVPGLPGWLWHVGGLLRAHGAAALGSMDAHQSLLFWSAPCSPALPRILSQVQAAASQRKTCDVFLAVLCWGGQGLQGAGPWCEGCSV